MCGIAGFVGQRVRQEQLAAMGAAMVRRGPDDDGYYFGHDVGLAFRRLAIVDLSGGRQPMANEDGTVHVVFNGEIYDHTDLRRDLERRGHRFVTDHSDTEVLVHGFEEWDDGLFSKLNGMFAAAFWNQKTRSLTLARDRYGIKPLYYARLPLGGLVFASEIKAILASGLVNPAANERGILEYFTFQNLIERQTMFRGIEQLPPGTLLTWREGRISEKCYWDITFPRGRKATPAQLAEEHRAILRRALKRQIAADVPVKTYLSGGIDSTAITVTAHQFDSSVTAYSCIFDLTDVGDDRHVDEREYSRLVARQNGIERIEVELPADHLSRCLDEYVFALEDLRMGMGYPVFAMAERVAQDAKVVLSGTGGDEFHAGYVGRYRALERPHRPSGAGWKSRVRSWLRLLRGGASDAPTRYFPSRSRESLYLSMLNHPIAWEHRPSVFMPEFLREAGNLDCRDVITGLLARCPSSDWRDRVLYVDAKTYLTGLLVMEDKLSMHHSLETRVPLLDNELVDFVLDVPFEALWQGDTGKKLFRESVRPFVPERIYHKPKMGFGPPEASWYRGKLKAWVRDTLLTPQARLHAVFQPRFVRAAVEDHLLGRRDNTYLLWSLLNLETWCRVFGFYGAGSLGRARSA